jgi:hypothetical protein
MFKFFLIFIFFINLCFADGCKLNNPDRVIGSYFIGSVGYKVNFLKDEQGKDYTIYDVYNNKNIYGRVLCLRQEYLGNHSMDLVIAFDNKKTLKNIYYQKLLYGDLDLFDASFLSQFIGLNSKTINEKKLKDPSKTQEDREIYLKTIEIIKNSFNL